MKLELIREPQPEPPIKDVVLTLTLEEAEFIKWCVNDATGPTNARDRFNSLTKNILSKYNPSKCFLN